MPSFGLGVTQPILPWWRGPRPGLGRFNSPFGEFPVPAPDIEPPAISFVMVKPYHIDFTHWASTLAVDFQQDFVPTPPQEWAWRQWAYDLVNSPSFYNQNAPFPDERYATWQAWAEALYNVMVPSNIGPDV
jgi:hypothetical protein